MDRLLLFLPSLLTLASICLVSWLFSRSAKLEELVPSKEWIKAHLKEYLLWTGSSIIFATSLDTLIFQAPLIVIFSSITRNAWYAIVASSILQAIWYQRHKTITDKSLLRLSSRAITFIYNTLICYLGITSQTVWVAFGMHFSGLSLPILIGLLYMVISLCQILWILLQIIGDLVMECFEKIDNAVYDWKRRRQPR